MDFEQPVRLQSIRESRQLMVEQVWQTLKYAKPPYTLHISLLTAVACLLASSGLASPWCGSTTVHGRSNSRTPSLKRRSSLVYSVVYLSARDLDPLRPATHM